MATVSARIRVEIEVEVGNWNGQATFDELKDQVRREGRQIVNRLFETRTALERLKGRVVGEPKVVFVAVAEDEGKAGE